MGVSRPHEPPTRTVLLACLCALATAAPQSNEAEMFWPQWRGPLATGAAPHGDPPVEWSETKNIRWKVEIPGRASASPIVWGDRVFVLTAIPTGDAVSSGSGGLLGGLLRRLGLEMSVEPTHVQQFTVLAIDRSSGQLVWQRTAREEIPHQGAHPTGSWASGSAVTDGKHLWAFFGSRGLYCYDMEGNLIWEHDFGDLNIKQGFGEGARQRSTATRSSSTGTTRGNRSSRRSTSARAGRSGERTGMRRRHGRPLWWWNMTAEPKS